MYGRTCCLFIRPHTVAFICLFKLFMKPPRSCMIKYTSSYNSDYMHIDMSVLTIVHLLRKPSISIVWFKCGFLYYLFYYIPGNDCSAVASSPHETNFSHCYMEGPLSLQSRFSCFQNIRVS